MIASAQFRLMAQEGHLASAALLSGFEGVRNINYDKPGSVYSTMFNLATGFERLLKIIVILQYRFKNDLKFPTDKKLKSLSHSIDALYRACQVEGEERGIVDDWPASAQGHHSQLLTVLTEFAKGSRYHNLDQMVGGFQNADPLRRWFEVHSRIADRSLSYRRREAVMARARDHCERLRLFGYEMGPMGRYDLTIDITYQLEIARMTTGHMVWAIIELLRPLYHVLDRVVEDVQQMEADRAVGATVPCMTEFFPFGLTLREAALRRRQWTKLFHIAGRL